MTEEEMIARIRMLESIVDALLFPQPEVRDRAPQAVAKEPMRDEAASVLLDEWQARYKPIGDQYASELAKRTAD